jgi:ribosomal protein S27AE
METTDKPLKLETETCPRCGGSGRFSWNAMHGDRCYGCGGAGERYTKRGAAAAAFLKGLREVRADSVKPGDKLRIAGISGAKWYIVESVAIGLAKEQGSYRMPGDYQQVFIVFEGPLGPNKMRAYHDVDYMMVKAWSKEESRAQLLRALEYQETLTKAGTPRKSKKV